jgi:nicotinate-nucleotide--dimethylbenzimidazole phosphoribosyltransferase
MRHPLRPTGTAATPASPPSAGKRRANPDLNLSPRCGARTRAGCPCRAPAIRGKLRCPAGLARGQAPHGGRSTGPRTPEGRARIAAAHTRHSPASRARTHHIQSLTRRCRVFRDALEHLDRLPPDLAARFRQLPPELDTPPWPAAGLTPAEDRAMQRAEAAALAPWKAAIALARQAAWKRPGAATGQRGAARAEAHAPVPLPRDPAAPGAQQADVAARPHAPERARDPGAATEAPSTASSAAQAEPHAPEREAGGAAIPAASPHALAKAQAAPHAPEQGAGARASHLAPTAAPAKPHAPETVALAGGANPAAPLPAPALPEATPHAPEQARAAEGASPAPSPNRAARRWMRRQERLQQRRAASGRR